MSITQAIQIENPLPRRYLTDSPGIGGRIKVRPEDFLVDELPLYEPCGEGEHLYLGIQKTSVSHGELIATLRRSFNVRESAIGFAGMKDKLGVTRQMVSIHLPGTSEGNRQQGAGSSSELPIAHCPLPTASGSLIDHDRINILWEKRHRNKIRLGHLAGNRFAIRVRDVDPMKAPAALRTLRTLEQIGVPNYFGAQRFGYRRNNHLLGAAVLTGDYPAALAHLLGSAGGPYPEYQRPRREHFDAGQYPEAAQLWTTADRAERIASTALARGRSLREACEAVGGTALSFFISAFQSALFNHVLDQRIDERMLDTLVAGDVAFKHSNHAVFLVKPEELAALPARVAALELSPSGPLWGRDMIRAAGPVAERERQALALGGLTEEALLASERCPQGARRALRCPISNASVDSGIDEHGPYIRVAFDLPRGAYATIVLREIMKSEESEAVEASD